MTPVGPVKAYTDRDDLYLGMRDRTGLSGFHGNDDPSKDQVATVNRKMLDTMPDGFKRPNIRRAIQSCWVGGEIGKLLNNSDQIVLVQGTDRKLGAAAILDIVQGDEAKNTHVDIRAYGATPNLRNGHINSNLLEALAYEIWQTSVRVVDDLNKLFGDKYEPSVRINLGEGLTPKAESMEMIQTIDSLLAALENVQNGIPRGGQGFGELLEALNAQRLKMGNGTLVHHPVAKAIAECRSFETACTPTMGDVASYPRSQEIATRVKLVLDALMHELDAMGESLFPAKTTVAPMEYPSSENGQRVSVRIKHDRMPKAVLEFTPPVSDGDSAAISIEDPEIDGAISEASGILLKAIFDGEWFKK